MIFDSTIVSMGLGMLGGGLAATWMRAALLLMFHQQKFHWSLFLPTPQPIIVTIPPALIAMACIYGKAEWTPAYLVVCMMCAGLTSYAFAIAWQHSSQLTGWGKTIRFNHHLIRERKEITDMIRNLLGSSAQPEEWIVSFENLLHEQQKKFLVMMAEEETIQNEIDRGAR